jgi:hypothetical protein
VEVALVVTLYQGYRGFMFQWLLGLGKEVPEKEVAWKKWSPWRRVSLLCLADMFTYMVCSGSGFFSLWLAYRIWNRIPNINEISVGLSTIMIALTIYGILGITAKLPDRMHNGKLW